MAIVRLPTCKQIWSGWDATRHVISTSNTIKVSIYWKTLHLACTYPQAKWVPSFLSFTTGFLLNWSNTQFIAPLQTQFIQILNIDLVVIMQWKGWLPITQVTMNSISTTGVINANAYTGLDVIWIARTNVCVCHYRLLCTRISIMQCAIFTAWGCAGQYIWKIQIPS